MSLSSSSTVPIGQVGSAAIDAELLTATAAGDDASFGLLYRRTAGVIRGRLRYRCGDPELVEEVLQDTFLAVWRSAERWNGSGEVRAWIWGIAVRRLADALRAHLAHPSPPLHTDEGLPSAEEECLRDPRYGDVGQALSRLPPDLQLVVRMTIERQLTTREAAALLGIPQGTVKTRMMRARAVLRHALT